MSDLSISRIRDLTIALEQALRLEPTDAQRGELAGPLEAVLVSARTFLGKPYEYGVPGSDPNVEQLSDGRLRISLIQPITSGSEKIEVVIMRPSTVGDQLQAQDTAKVSGDSEGALAKLSAVLTTEAGRKLARAEMRELIEEDSTVLLEALSFLAGRFRRTRRVFKTP